MSGQKITKLIRVNKVVCHEPMFGYYTYILFKRDVDRACAELLRVGFPRSSFKIRPVEYSEEYGKWAKSVMRVDRDRIKDIVILLINSKVYDCINNKEKNYLIKKIEWIIFPCTS